MAEGVQIERQRLQKLLSLEQCETRTDVSRYTWRAWARVGRIPHVRLGRRLLIDEQDLERFIAANRVEAK